MRIIPVIVISLLLCGVGICAESQPPPPTPSKTIKNHERYSSQKNHNTQIANQLGSTITDHPKTNENEERHKDYSSSEWWLVYLTFALVVVTLGLAIYTAKLYRATVGLGKDAKSTSDRQAAEMEKSLTIAKEAAEATQKAAEAAELNARAAIGIELPIIRTIATDLLSTDTLITGEGPYSGGVDDGPPTKYSAVGYIRFENHGRTPAFPEKISVGWMVAEKLPENPTYLKTSNLNHAAVIKPDGNFAADTHYGIELTDEELQATKEARAWLWFYGCLYYNDFLHTKRTARFCWRFANRDFDSVSYYFSSDGEPPAQYTQDT